MGPLIDIYMSEKCPPIALYAVSWMLLILEIKKIGCKITPQHNLCEFHHKWFLESIRKHFAGTAEIHLRTR